MLLVNDHIVISAIDQCMFTPGALDVHKDFSHSQSSIVGETSHVKGINACSYRSVQVTKGNSMSVQCTSASVP